MAWQKYEQNKTKANVRASISPAGSINLTRAVQEMFNVERGKTDFAQLYFDNTINCIGIEFLSKKNKDTLKIIFRGPTKSDGFSISAKSFLVHFDRLPQQTQFYCVAPRDGMLAIDLSTARGRTTALNITEYESLSLATNISFKATKPAYYKLAGGKKVPATNWRALYRNFIVMLYKNYPNKMDAIFADVANDDYHWIISPRSAATISRPDLWERLIPEYDMYFYVNKSADEIIRSMRILANAVGIPLSNVEFGIRN